MTENRRLLRHVDSFETIPDAGIQTIEDVTKQIEGYKKKLQLYFDRLSKGTQGKLPIEVWKLDSFQQRNNFKGFKIRILWKDIDRGYRARLKLCSPKEIGGKKANYDNYCLEIEDVNVVIDNKKVQNSFYKQLQHYLDLQIAQLLGSSKRVYSIGDQAWVIQLFPKVGAILRQQFIRGNAKKVDLLEDISLQKQRVNQNYILIPALSNFTWHPKGFLFLVQNKVSTSMTGSLIGNKKMMNMVFPIQKIQRQTSFEYLTQIPFNIDDPYDWNIKETYDFLDGKYELDEIGALETLVSSNSNESNRFRSLSMPFKSVNDINSISTDIKDIIEAKFLNPSGNLKLFSISNGMNLMEDQIKEVVTYLNNHKQILNVLEILTSSIYKNSESLFHEKVLGPFQIKIVQQVFKSSFNLNDYSSFLKSVMAETQCNHSVIINTFNRNLIQLGAPQKYQDKMWIYHQQVMSYNDFDQYQLQDIFFIILELYLKKLKDVQPDKKEIFNPLFTDQVYVQVKTSPYINPIEYVKFVQDPIYSDLIKKFIPLYEIRIRNFNFVQYTKIMRIFSANQRLRSCVESINNLIKDSNSMKDPNYLQEVIRQYSLERVHLSESRQRKKKRRAWRVQCFKCNHKTTTNEVLQNNFVCFGCRIS